MSKELADRFDRDLSADDETQERLRRVSKQSAALDVDWEAALAVYRTQANRDPKELVRFSGPERRMDDGDASSSDRTENSSRADD